MEETDDLSKLEELFAADSSEDETVELKDGCTNSITPSEPKAPLFLLQEVEQEKSILSLGKENKAQSIYEHLQPNNTKTENCSKKKISSNANNSLIHNGDTDSSDDEDRRNYLERKYSEFGSDVKKLMQQKDENKTEYVRDAPRPIQSASFKTIKNAPPAAIENKLIQNKDIYTDPIFGMRIIKPLISSTALKERMQGREAVTMCKVKRHVVNGDLTKDWVVAGVIVRKSASKESQKGAQYSIWTLSDLKDDLKTVSVFLFRNAYKQLWKTNQGMVIGILNPSVLDKRDDSTDQACLSVDIPEKVMIFGNSKDFGFCKSKKKNGDPCTAFVNLNLCEYCIYHVKQEYQKCSRRSELQSSTSGRGLVDLRNKVLGKNTVIYGGQSFSAIPAVKNKKQTAKDINRLQSLSDYFRNSEQQPLLVNKSPIGAPPVKKNASRVDASRSQRLKDLERLEFLSAGSSKHINMAENGMAKETTMESIKKTLIQSSKSTIQAPKPSFISPKPSLSLSSNLSANQNNVTVSPNTPLQLKCPTLGIPTLGFGLKSKSLVDLTLPFSKKQSERAKVNAMKWIKQNGPLNKTNPNNVRGTEEGKKRSLSKLNISTEVETSEETEPTAKKAKTGIASERFQKMLAATSSHTDLIVEHDDTEVDKYFNKLEKKEMMEEKMLNTYKVACKAVRCIKCKYTSFSAAERCKQEKHPLKVFDTVKRFFKCSNCSNRHISLEVIPTQPCKNCHHNRWQRAGMMAERKTVTLASTLSITGGEEFLGHNDIGTSINLLVSEDGA